MRCPFTARLLTAVAACLFAGCRAVVPLHVWEPPALESTVGKEVVLTTVVGPDDLSRTLREKLLASVPQEPGLQTRLIDFQDLPLQSDILLVSATDDEPNDLALAAMARDQDVGFLLRGEVIETRNANNRGEARDSLTISWRLTALDNESSGGGMPVTIDTATAIDRYPDLDLGAGNDEVLTTAAVRESLRLLTPSVRRRQVEIEVPYVLPGSRDVRRGNAAAQAGRWGEAQEIWLDVVSRHPNQVSAIHNLALAAAAAQDFSLAKQLARRAVRLAPSDHHKQTLVWIESRQRDYHRAFNLPDPPEGWFLMPDLSAMDATGVASTR